MTKGLRIIVRGRVQGVGFRAWTVATARTLGLVGWVRNCRDGSVEILAGGEAQSLERLAAACRRGPPAATVAVVDARPADAPDSTGFVQARTE